MATKTSPSPGPTDSRDRLLTLLEEKTGHLVEKFRRQRAQLSGLRQERDSLLEERERLKGEIRALEQKLSVRGDTEAVAPVLELRREVDEMIELVEHCLELIDNDPR